MNDFTGDIDDMPEDAPKRSRAGAVITVTLTSLAVIAAAIAVNNKNNSQETAAARACIAEIFEVSSDQITTERDADRIIDIRITEYTGEPVAEYIWNRNTSAYASFASDSKGQAIVKPIHPVDTMKASRAQRHSPEVTQCATLK